MMFGDSILSFFVNVKFYGMFIDFVFLDLYESVVKDIFLIFWQC